MLYLFGIMLLVSIQYYKNRECKSDSGSLNILQWIYCIQSIGLRRSNSYRTHNDSIHDKRYVYGLKHDIMISFDTI